MAGVKDAAEVEEIVASLYPDPLEPQPYNFEIYQHGDAWVVIYNVLTDMEIEVHEVHIDAGTGKMLMII